MKEHDKVENKALKVLEYIITQQTTNQQKETILEGYGVVCRIEEILVAGITRQSCLGITYKVNELQLFLLFLCCSAKDSES